MDNNCTVYKTADFIGKRWTILILLELYKGNKKKKRFSAIKKSLPNITSKILSSRLKELEKNNLIKKTTEDSKFPIKCEYCLTRAGNEFIPIIKNIKAWSLKHKFKNKICLETNCKNCEI